MKGQEKKREAKKEKSDKKIKVLTDYQREKQSKSDKGMSIIPRTEWYMYKGKVLYWKELRLSLRTKV